MTELQRATYIKVLEKRVEKMNSRGELSPKSMSMILMDLKKAANHPFTIENIEPNGSTAQDIVDNSGKFQILHQLLQVLHMEKRRIVIFSQSVKMIDIIDDYLLATEYKFLRLDGTTKSDQRFADITAFNDPKSDHFIYLISTRAGGLGINLQSADTVIFYDSDWNPQVILFKSRFSSSLSKS